MAFIDSNKILVLEKDGNVRLVSNGKLQQQPVLHLPVDTESERGLLGIAFMNNSNYVFLYYTDSQGVGGELRNRVYRYEWNGQGLVNAKLVLDRPALSGPNHDGGKLAIGPDNYLYTVRGDLNHRGNLQNILGGPDPDDTSGIFKIDLNDGSAARNNPFLANPDQILHKYYAYGVRNSFGLAFDPITGSLWDTENGRMDPMMKST